jgi:hypothetical protein
MDIEITREVEFRDGVHEIPAYLADMMVGLPTHTMTVEEAIAKANAAAVERHMYKAYDQLIDSHFGRVPR